MVQYNYEFVLTREIQDEEVELLLCVDLDIEPLLKGKYSGAPEDCYPEEGGNAQIAGTIFIKNDEELEPWGDVLTEEERETIEVEGYEKWAESEAEAKLDMIDEDNYCAYDNFDDEREIRFSGGGKVFY